LKNAPTRCFVEVAHLVNGEVVSVRRLSRRREWRAAFAAAAVVMALAAAAASVVALVLLAAHRVVYGPGYLALWLGMGLGAAAVAASRARARARRYGIGAALDDDAFSPIPIPLVRRSKGAYHLMLIPGMKGRVEGGTSPILVESLVQDRDVTLPLRAGSRIEVSLDATTFVVTAHPGRGRGGALPRGFATRYARRALMPLQLAILASVLLAVPAARYLGEADMRSAIPTGATPWEVEKMLRAEAQAQSHSLHRCFDVLPVECQHPGYVGVGLSLSRDGEIRTRWIARSTFGQDCPVDQCMSDVIGSWFFEPLPESMRVVLPVQVLRTEKPLPLGAARAAENAARRGLARNELN
jgi:hypothetical protein